LVLGWFTCRVRQVARSAVAAQHNNPNAPDRREVVCEYLRLLAAGDWERWAAWSLVEAQLSVYLSVLDAQALQRSKLKAVEKTVSAKLA